MHKKLRHENIQLQKVSRIKFAKSIPKSKIIMKSYTHILFIINQFHYKNVISICSFVGVTFMTLSEFSGIQYTESSNPTNPPSVKVEG